MSGEEVVLLERHDHVLVMTINRPQVKNAVNGAVAEQLEAAMADLDSDRDLWAGIITGSGGFFSSGQDLVALQRGDVARTERGGFFGFLDRPPDKVLIAAVEGVAYAGGFELALGCDLIVAAENVRFGIPEVSRGLVALGGALITLPRRLPYHVVMEMAVTGEPRTAPELLAHGLISRVSEPGQALAQALSLAEAVCRNGPLAVRISRRVLRQSIAVGDTAPLQEYQVKQWESEAPMDTDDFCEGMKAFAEKRPPRWQNR